MVKLVATLGKTPGGVAETYVNLTSGNFVSSSPGKVNISEVVAVITKEVYQSFYFLQALFLCCLNVNKIGQIVLPFNDVTSPDEFIYVRESVRKVLRANDYLDFTGGRKAISAAAVLAGREVGARLVSTVIDQEEYLEMNRKFHEMKDRASRVLSKEECSPDFCTLISERSKTIVYFG
ncbi:CRISPR-associated ring nuclease Crn1 [Metallosphaera cuprina]|uniref:Uncharacterized protein n=1 Tax=Metallosphaera cuprina (strain Ar-4) TaxID=1006006 RepID=F4G315_METCR|nr:CRISPR-associated ring nuclease Crn1 [Metallosphaera cuprina]AEB95213.1 conserved hypothetical protein [Metallosphaera cuprina Ar-4]